MNRSKTALLAYLCIALGGTGLYLVNNAAFWAGISPGSSFSKTVGTVRKLQGNVRHRSSHTPLWKDLTERPSPVGEGDNLFTAENSEAEIRFSINAPLMKLSPNSLVTIQPQTKPFLSGLLSEPPPPLLELRSGQMRLSLKPGDRPAAIRNREKLFHATAKSEAAELILTLDSTGTFHMESTAPLELREDPVNGGQIFDLKENYSLKIHPESGTSDDLVFVRPLLPRNNERLWFQAVSGEETTEVRFEWLLTALAAKAEMKLVIEEKTEENGKLVWIPYADHKVLPGKTTASVTLKKGIFRWRLETDASSAGPSTRSPLSEFEIIPAIPPQVDSLLLSRQEISHESRSETLFYWTPPAMSAATELEIFDTSIADALARSRHSSPWTTLSLSNGTYHWRIRALYFSEDQELQSPWAGPFALTISSPTPAPTPEPSATAAPVIETIPTIDSEATEGSTRLHQGVRLNQISVLLRWKPIQGVRQYRVDIYDDRKRPISQKTTLTSSYLFTIDRIDNTQYHYQVSARLPSGVEISGQPTPILINFAPPVLKVPVEGAIISAKTESMFVWEKTSLTRQYHLQISRNSDFSTLLLDKKLRQNWALETLREQGRYYWRVKSLSAVRESQWSNASSLEVTP